MKDIRRKCNLKVDFLEFTSNKKMLSEVIVIAYLLRSQDFDLSGASSKDKIASKMNVKILIDINNKLNKQLYGNIIFLHKLK